MSLSRRPLLSLLLLALLGGASVAASAAPQHGKRKPPPAATGQSQEQPAARGNRGRDDDAMADSIRRVERSTGGQVLSAERVPYEGRSVNRIKVVDDRGRVRVYTDDPGQQSDGGQPESQSGRSDGQPGRRRGHRPPSTRGDNG